MNGLRQALRQMTSTDTPYELAYQKSEYRDAERDEAEVGHFLNVKLPKIRRLAAK